MNSFYDYKVDNKSKEKLRIRPRAFEEIDDSTKNKHGNKTE